MFIRKRPGFFADEYRTELPENLKEGMSEIGY
jgi:hypothetical protein